MVITARPLRASRLTITVSLEGTASRLRPTVVPLVDLHMTRGKVLMVVRRWLVLRTAGAVLLPTTRARALTVVPAPAVMVVHQRQAATLTVAARPTNRQIRARVPVTASRVPTGRVLAVTTRRIRVQGRLTGVRRQPVPHMAAAV